MLIVLAFQLLSNVIGVNADYGCLCIHGGTSDVYYQPFILSTMLGHLRDGDCKPTFQAGTSVNWTAIQFHNQIGFIVNTSIVHFYNCQGNPLEGDAFPTASSSQSTTSTKQTTTSNAPIKVTTIASMKKTMTKTIATSTKRIAMLRTATQIPQSTNVLTTSTRLHCPPQVRKHGVRDYMEVNGRCYEFNMDPHRNWPDAEHDCNTRGGHLVSIGSMAEQNVVYNALRRKHFYHGDNDVWIGLTDKDVEGHWRWSSGDRSKFTYWAPGDGHGNFEDCALLEMDQHGHWGDISCEGFLFSHERHGYICEYNLV